MKYVEDSLVRLDVSVHIAKLLGTEEIQIGVFSDFSVLVGIRLYVEFR